MRNVSEQTILNAIGIKTATFTAATTDIITANSHGLRNGDKVVLTTTTTLPAGLALATVYWIIEATTNTFKLSANSVPYFTTGVAGEIFTAVDITDTGTGNHTFTMHNVGNSILVEDYRHAVIALDTDGGGDAVMKIQFQGSTGKSLASTDAPDFSASQSPTNRWGYVEIVDLEDGSTIDGDTGVTSATDLNRQFEVNVNGLRWLNAIISGWSEGEVSVSVQLYND